MLQPKLLDLYPFILLDLASSSGPGTLPGAPSLDTIPQSFYSDMDEAKLNDAALHLFTLSLLGVIRRSEVVIQDMALISLTIFQHGYSDPFSAVVYLNPRDLAFLGQTSVIIPSSLLLQPYSCPPSSS